MKLLTITSSMLIGVALTTGAAALDVDWHFPPYKPVPLDSAQIKSVGSHTLGDLMRKLGQCVQRSQTPRQNRHRKQRIKTPPPRCWMERLRLGRCLAQRQLRRDEPFEKKSAIPSPHPFRSPLTRLRFTSTRRLQLSA